MTITVPPPIFSSPLSSGRFAQTGDMPSVTAMRRAAMAINNASLNHRKVLFARSYTRANTPASGPTHIYFPFRSGENVSSVAMMIGIAPAESTVGSGTGACQLGISVDSGPGIRSPLAHYPKVQAGSYNPDEVAWSWVEITTDDGLASDTQYIGYINQANKSRIHSVLVYEIALPVADSSVDGVTDPLLWEANKPIYDAGVQDIAEAGTKLWQHNGAHLLSWSRPSSAGVPSITGTAWQNLLKTAASVYSATDPSFVLATQYHDSQKGDIPVEFGMRVRRTGGAGTLTVELVNSGGTILTATAAASAITPYDSTTATIAATASPDQINVLCKCSDGGTTFEIDCIGLWEYEA